MDRVISSVAEHRKVPRTLPTGGAIYAHHYTGKVHYVAQGGGWKEDQIKDHGYYTEATGKIGYGKEMQKRNVARRKRQMEEFSSRGVDHQYDLPFQRQMRAGYQVTVA